ncbi:MAG: hypothetical protein LBE84_10395, partial [Planctomycetota bacterium]|nr:hypothetical protein [Planctomycetota bacterium]
PVAFPFARVFAAPEEFQRHRPAKNPMLGEVYHAHAAAGDFMNKIVVAYPAAGTREVFAVAGQRVRPGSAFPTPGEPPAGRTVN